MRAVIVAFFVVFFLPVAHCQDAAVPISSEPHHHLVLQNDLVRVWTLQLGPHEKTLPYTVPHDCISAIVQNGQSPDLNVITATGFAPAGKPEQYARGPFTDVWKNGTNESIKIVAVELLRQQGGVFNECEEVPGGEKSGCHANVELGHTVLTWNKNISGLMALFRTQETQVVALCLFGGKHASVETGSHDGLLVFNANTDVTFENVSSKKLSFAEGDVLWVPAGSFLTVKNRSKLLICSTQLGFR